MSDFEPDRITIATPEGVDVELVIAGIGSRFLAMFIDQVIQLLVLLGIWIVMINVVNSSFAALTALGTVALFLVQFGYFVLFESLDSGRSPGRRVVGTRVVTIDGGPVPFLAVAIRNVLRIVDALPSFYLVGLIAAMTSSRGQRLGDMAAATLVIREGSVSVHADGHAGRRSNRHRRSSQANSPALNLPRAESRVLWDLSAVTAAEVSTVRSFLGRRSTLDPAARQRLALQLASALRPKVAGVVEFTPEQFLERLVALKDDRG